MSTASIPNRKNFLLGLLLISLSIVALYRVYTLNKQPGNYRGNDIYHIWSDGYEIAHGVNPYSKIHGSDMLKNNKYSTYLPGFFLLVSTYVSLGYETFDEWLKFWRPLSFLIHCSLGLLIFCALFYKSGLVMGLFGANFWLLSRWPISVMNSGQIDLLTIMIVLLALLVLPHKRRLALVIFGASLSIKQIGIFMLPVFLLYCADLKAPWRETLRTGIYNLMAIALIPFLTSLPFLIWDAKGLLMSILFSATRSPGGHIKVPSIDEILGYVGLVAKIPMLTMLVLLYLAVMFRKIGLFSASLAVYLVFMSFNSVIFKQYMPWFCAFVGLALSEIKMSNSETHKK
jgi:uncharacterized membrane protein